MSPSIPPVAVLIAHRVADYSKWKQAFDEHQPSRVQAGCLGHDVHRDADDDRLVYVYCPAKDAETLKAFVESPDLPDVMRNAGVEGEPDVTLMTPKSESNISNEKLPGIIVMHAVADYDSWRVIYDETEALRKEHGIVGHAVNHELGNPHEVIIYHQAREMASLRAFLDSAGLRDAMQRAGVTGPPDIRFVHATDICEY